MSWTKKGKDFVHPYTFFLVNSGIDACQDFLNEGRYLAATDLLYNLVGWLDGEAQKELQPICNKIEEILDDTSLLTRKAFREIQTTISKKLHKEGYFITAKIKPKAKTTRAVDFGKKIRKGLEQ